ncbi:MAG: hypothetical protein A4E51_01447 [Methanosaeta sp. PtaU1.Bin055]|nr:MAG: hypothetical protein A4E51_01447 [Methanosaeta sp. PtaU1.Bin055]
MDLISETPFPNMFESIEGREPPNCLFQGDIIEIVEGKSKIFTGQTGAIGYLVGSNSCDLVNNNLKTISLVPIYPFDVWYSKFSEKNAKNIAKELRDELEYKRKQTFLISPLEKFGNKPSIAFVDDIRSIKSDRCINILLKFRFSSLKAPWREQLGYKLGNIFNRVSTYTPEIDALHAWVEKYKREKSQ